VSTPEDKKIDFEKLTLSEDMSGSLEPIANGTSDQLLSELEAEAKAKPEEEPAEEEVKVEKSESVAGEGAKAPTISKFKSLTQKLIASDPYTVLLAVTVAVLLIAILFCLVELGRYGFDLGAKKARSAVTISAPIDISHLSC
jgi:hypothetical protein